MLEKLFKTSIQRHIEKKSKLENEIEVLKTQQKVKSEIVISEYDSKKTQHQNTIDAQIAALQNEIENLKVSRTTHSASLDKEKVVQLKKVDNEFEAKILSKQNEVKKLSNLIDKEQKDMEDLITPLKPNAPKDNRKILVENITPVIKNTKKSKK